MPAPTKNRLVTDPVALFSEEHRRIKSAVDQETKDVALMNNIHKKIPPKADNNNPIKNDYDALAKAKSAVTVAVHNLIFAYEQRNDLLKTKGSTFEKLFSRLFDKPQYNLYKAKEDSFSFYDESIKGSLTHTIQETLKTYKELKQQLQIKYGTELAAETSVNPGKAAVEAFAKAGGSINQAHNHLPRSAETFLTKDPTATAEVTRTRSNTI